MYTKANLASLRVKKDIAELSRQRLNAAHASTSIDFPDGTRNLLKIKVGVSMNAGLYEGATFYFLLTIPPSYPFHAPSVVCMSRAWHPNIDLHTGYVSLPILNKDWRPVLSINTVVFALQLMFIEPTEQFPINEPAAAALANPEVFREQVQRTLAGGFLFGVQFEPHGQGTGGGKGGPAGAAQKRKRGDGMDTEAVQTTLQAMRIQGDEAAEESAWDKRPRHQQQQLVAAALGQTARCKDFDSHGQRFSVDGETLAPFGDHLYHHHHAQQQPSLPQPITVPVEPAFGSATAPGVTAFDRLRYHTLGDAELAASSVGLRCGGVQAGIPQPPVGAIGEGGAAAVGWGGGKFQAVPPARFQ